MSETQKPVADIIRRLRNAARPVEGYLGNAWPKNASLIAEAADTIEALETAEERGRREERERIVKMIETRAGELPYPSGKVVADELMDLAGDIRAG